MNKTKIEWCDYTWNPITGCFGPCGEVCGYCYAAGIARRFAVRGELRGKACETGECHVFDKPYYTLDKHGNSRVSPYPFGFDPTFHRYCLDEPQRVKRPSLVFVGSMAGLFGEWVPAEWISAVFDACEKAPQHKYLFLTKNPERYGDINSDIGNPITTCAFDNCDINNNMWMGATATNDKQLEVAYGSGASWLSVEPLREELSYTEECFSVHNQLALECGRWDWVVIGAESGNRKDKVVPKREWIEAIVDTCRYWGTPIFMKSNLKSVWGEKLIQEYPEGLKQWKR